MKRLIWPLFAVAVVAVAALFFYESYDIWTYRILHRFRQPGKVVYYVPYRGAAETEAEFCRTDPTMFFDRLKERFAARGYTLKYTPLNRIPCDGDYWLVINQRRRRPAAWREKMLPADRKVGFVFEPPSIEPLAFEPSFYDRFSSLYYFAEKAVDGQKRHKFHYPHLLKAHPEWVPFASKRLCTLVAGNKYCNDPSELYTARREAIAFFEQYAPSAFTFYGRQWSGMEHPCYGGEISDKLEVMRHYRFSICYENSIELGNLTEKIFDSFCAGCVPVYWGDPNVEQWIPKDCFVDRRDFDTIESLYAYLSSMDEETYEGYLARIAAYLKSDLAQVHAIDVVADLMVNAVDSVAKSRE